ncbi:MAG: aminotransferase class IV [Bacteroidota bacterium]
MLIMNGKVLEAGAPETNLLNRGFKFGDGLFLEMRIFKGKVLFLEEHMGRMLAAMHLLKFSFDKNLWLKEIEEAIQKSIDINQIDRNGRIQLHLFRAGIGAFQPLSNEVAYLLEAYALKDDYFTSSIPVSLCDYQEMLLASGTLSPFYCANTLSLSLAAIYAKEEGFDHALLYGAQGPSMSSFGNVFLIKQKKLFTPSFDTACVDGVMRAKVIELCKGLKIPVHEKKLRPKDFVQADEIFISNELRGIVPVNNYQGREIEVKQYVISPFIRQCLLQFIEKIS